MGTGVEPARALPPAQSNWACASVSAEATLLDRRLVAVEVNLG